MSGFVSDGVEESEYYEFGSSLKSKCFYLDSDFINLNHGSFGTVSKYVHQKHEQLFLLSESFPDIWFRQIYFDKVNENRLLISQLINCSIDDIVLVENASTAVNSLLRSMTFSKGDKVVVLSTAYKMVNHTLIWLKKVIDIEVIIVPILFPVQSPNDIINSFNQIIRSHDQIKLCIFSHISSMPTMIEPVKELVALTHSINALAFVDGAHAPGVLRIDIQDIDADYYTGNCHKWCYCPKGAAFFYVRRSLQGEIHPQPTVISSSGKDDFVGRFVSVYYTLTSTHPYGYVIPLMTVDVLTKVDVDVQFVSCWRIAFKWVAVEDETMIGFMANIVLPSSNPDAITHLSEQLFLQHKIYIVTGKISHEDLRQDYQSIKNHSSNIIYNDTSVGKSFHRDVYFVRLSSQVYLDNYDFEKFGSLVPQLLFEIDKDMII